MTKTANDGLVVDMTVAPDRVATQLQTLLSATGKYSGSGQSPLSLLINQYEYEMSASERDVVIAAVALIFDDARAQPLSEAAVELLPSLLYLAGEILPTHAIRARRRIVYDVEQIADAFILRNRFLLATSIINFVLSAGLLVEEGRLNSWATAIGPPAVLPTFAIKLRRSIENAVTWLFDEANGDDLVESVFEGTLDAVFSGDLLLENAYGGPLDLIGSAVQAATIRALRSQVSRGALADRLESWLTARQSPIDVVTQAPPEGVDQDALTELQTLNADEAVARMLELANE